MRLEQKIRNFIEKFHMLSNGCGVIVGLSGGADSVALLEVLCGMKEELMLKLAAVHVHHGIREEAQEDADFCRSICLEKQVEFFCEYVDVPQIAASLGISEEEAGRNERYRIFEAYRRKLHFDVIAVAHHQNDQAETMLFQLFRGSGLRGLSGMQPRREMIIRPLLCVSRMEIEAYLTEKHADYVTDATNARDDYSRNKIRHHVMPVAEEISSGAAEHMSRTGMQLREVLDYMENQASDFLHKYSERHDAELNISVQALAEVHPALQKMVVSEAIADLFEGRKDITQKHIDGILELLEKDGEKTVYLPKNGLVVKRYHQLIFKKNVKDVEQETDAFLPLKIEPGESYVLKNGLIIKTRLISKNNLENIPKNDCIKWFDYDKIIRNLFLRTREQGDFLTIRDDGARKSLQDYLVNEKVPKSERDKVLVLAEGSHVLWVLGKRISAYYKVTAQTKRVIEIYIGGKACDGKS